MGRPVAHLVEHMPQVLALTGSVLTCSPVLRVSPLPIYVQLSCLWIKAKMSKIIILKV